MMDQLFIQNGNIPCRLANCYELFNQSVDRLPKGQPIESTPSQKNSLSADALTDRPSDWRNQRTIEICTNNEIPLATGK